MPETEMTVSKYLVSLIAKTGVKIIPVLQGGAVMKLIDEIGEHPDLQYICPNHEQALAMIVDAYARITGFGVGVATSGPGGLNLLTGIASAYYDSIPCLFITGQVGMYHIKGERKVRQRGFQETDIVSIAGPITKYAVMLDKPEDVKFVFGKCMHIAKSGRPGPVLIDVPYNVQRAMVNPEKLKSYELDFSQNIVSADIAENVKKSLDALLTAKKPVILVGGGVVSSGEIGRLKELVDLLKVPVVCTWGALDVFEPAEDLYLGTIGINGHRSAVEFVQQSDLVLALGARFTTKEVIDDKKFAVNARIIAVDIDSGELEDGLVSPNLKICADLRQFLPMILGAAHSLDAESSNFEENAGVRLKETALIKREKFMQSTGSKSSGEFVCPYHFAKILSDALIPPSIWVSDIGANLIWMALGYRHKMGNKFIASWGCGPMGYALPACVGAYFANPGATIVATTGDGGMQINIQELQTIVANRVPAKIFVLNNKCLANIKFGARKQFDGRIHAVDQQTGYSAPDFVNVARAYGVPAFYLSGHDNLEERVREILSMEGPVLVDIKIDPEQDVFENRDI